MYKNRNYKRVLDTKQIKDIINQIAFDLKESPKESAKYLMDLYLNNDADGIFELVSDWVEYAEDEVKRQLNIELTEDSFDDDQYTPHYDY
jgi:hypothetical protein